MYRVAYPTFAIDDATTLGLELDIRACSNPDCPCTSLMLTARAYDQRKGESRVGRTESIEAMFDVEDGSLSDLSIPSSFEQEGLLVELKRIVRSKRNKRSLAAYFGALRAEIMPTANMSYDFSAHHDATHAAYLDVFEEGGQILTTRGGVHYALDDAWCVVPSCACGDGVIDVFECRRGDASEVSSENEHVGTFWFLTRKPTTNRPSLAAGQIDDVLQPSIVSALRVRRDRLRAQAAREWGIEKPHAPRVAPRIDSEPKPFATAKTTPAKDVGRNDPCPCGSGKKFKRCCLGRAPSTSFSSFMDEWNK